MKKTRLANLELLRIIAMLMVVTAHLVNHGNMITAARQGSLSYYIVWTLFGVSFACINIYVLISGYFLIEVKLSTWKLAKMAGQVFFYAFGITLLFWLFFGAEHELKIMVYSVLPISSDFYWFISMYVGMYILAPFLNHFIRSLTKRQLECAMFTGFLLVSVWPNVIYFSSALNTAGGVSIAWFVTVYLFGAYIRLYYKPDGRFKHRLFYGMLAALLVPLSRFAIELLMKTPLGKISVLEDLMWGYSLFFTYSSILVTAASVLLFLAFLNLEVKPGKTAKFITTVAGAAFGVYLIHDHYYIRETLWPKIDGASWLGRWYLLPASLGVIFAVYAGCTLIELLRQKLFAPIDNNKRVRELFNRLDEKILRVWKGEGSAGTENRKRKDFKS